MWKKSDKIDNTWRISTRDLCLAILTVQILYPLKLGKCESAMIISSELDSGRQTYCVSNLFLHY
jgi:hypothetical protein